MVVVEYGYEEMRSLVDIPMEKMVETLSGLGAPSEYEPETGKIITELTPNRPDWYSMEGLARALRSYLFDERPEYSVEGSDYRVIVDPSVAEVRPYTACAVVKGLRFNDQRVRDMVLLQEKLLGTLGRRVKKFGLGIYPLDAIGFPVKFTTMEPDRISYIPLGHETRMSAKEIIENHKKGMEYGYLIKDFKRYPVFLDAKGDVMALIPVVNSAETGKVDEETEDIFIEVTGIDMAACQAALNILVCTFADMEGTVYEVSVEYDGETVVTPKLEKREMKVGADTINRVLGTRFSNDEISGLLSKMGYSYDGGTVSIPPYRADIIGPVDIIEDVAIAYGYNNFEPTIPDFFSAGSAIDDHSLVDSVMRGMGFLETKTFILTNKGKVEDTGFAGDLIEISNPSSVDFTVVRPDMLADMLQVLSTNKMKALPQRFYEIGIVHDQGMRKRLVFAIRDKELKFSDARGCLQTLAAEMGMDFSLDKKGHPIFEQDISSSIVSGGKEIGVFGKISTETMDRFNLSFDTYLCELRL